jgi:hypothetical protein
MIRAEQRAVYVVVLSFTSEEDWKSANKRHCRSTVSGLVLLLTAENLSRIEKTLLPEF